jgi:hypothetical protein
MRIEFNEDGMRRMLEEAAENIRKADESFRATHAGYPVEVVMADFASQGPAIDMPEAMLREYAECVSGGKPFKFVLQG